MEVCLVYGCCWYSVVNKRWLCGVGCGKMRMPEFWGVFLSLSCLVYVSACVCL